MAMNTGAPGEPSFTPDPNTPSVNNLLSAGLLTKNPNFVAPDGNPFRLTRAQAATCDQDHDYTDEQASFDLGLMDNFLHFNTGTCTGLVSGQPVPNAGHPNDLNMGYYDGNTVTALWNYAQNYAMNDNSYGTTFGPSSTRRNQSDRGQHQRSRCQHLDGRRRERHGGRRSRRAHAHQ